MSHPTDEKKRLFRAKRTKKQKLALQSCCAVVICSWICKHLSSLAWGVQSQRAPVQSKLNYFSMFVCVAARCAGWLPATPRQRWMRFRSEAVCTYVNIRCLWVSRKLRQSAC